jgi:hypothetical protein
MIGAALLLLAQATSSAAPPVVIVNNGENERPVDAMSWKCEAMLSHPGGSLIITGQFPAVSLEAQKNGDAFRLQATMKSEQDDRFSGTFPAALRENSGIAGISAYSILIPGSQPGRPKFILKFESFVRAGDGFLNVLQIDPTSGAPKAYAAGICTNEAAR